MKKLLLLLSIAALGSTFTSCKKEGCTDLEATNYSEDAKKDNGSCTYEGRAVIYYGEETATWLVDEGVTSLTYYIDNSLIGSSAANVYYIGTPDCGAEGTVNSTKNLGTTKGKTFSYQVNDQDGNTLWDGAINFEANVCMKLELQI